MCKYLSWNAEVQYLYGRPTVEVKPIILCRWKWSKSSRRHFSVDLNLIRYWRRQKEKLMGANKITKSYRQPKTGKFPNVDTSTLSVFYKTIQNKALEIAPIFNISDGQFKASIGWVIHFMRKQNLSPRGKPLYLSLIHI